MKLAVQDAATNIAFVRDSISLIKDLINCMRASLLRMQIFYTAKLKKRLFVIIPPPTLPYPAVDKS